jgi:hypothetical protein
MSTEQLKNTTAMPIAGKPPATVQVTWSGDHVFAGVRVSGGPAILAIHAAAERFASPRRNPSLDADATAAVPGRP